MPAGPTLSPAGDTPFLGTLAPSERRFRGNDSRPTREHLLRAILESSQEAVVSVSFEGVIETWSPGAEQVYGYTSKEIVGQRLSRLLPLYELPQIERPLRAKGSGGCSSIELCERLHKNGSRILLAIRRSCIRSDHNEALGVLEMAQALDFHEALWSPEQAPLSLLMDQVPGMLWTTDPNLKISAHWGAGLPDAKVRPGSLLGQSVCEFLGSADPHRTPILEHYEALRGAASHIEYTWRNRVLEIRVGPLRSASREIIGCLGAAADVTDRKKSEEQALFQARHDGLTGLANYREFMERLDGEVCRADRSQRSFTLLLLDLDGLKRINDLQGHLAGNRALRRLAAVVKEHCRSTDLAARYGGDEFAVLLIDSDRGMAEHVAQRIEQRLRSDHEKPQLSVSIGIGVYPHDGRTPAEMIEAADQRLYRRKKNSTKRSLSAPGRGCRSCAASASGGPSPSDRAS